MFGLIGSIMLPLVSFVTVTGRNHKQTQTTLFVSEVHPSVLCRYRSFAWILTFCCAMKRIRAGLSEFGPDQADTGMPKKATSITLTSIFS